MILLREILDEIMFEEISDYNLFLEARLKPGMFKKEEESLEQVIIDSIQRKKKMDINYDGPKKSDRGWRNIRPVALGTNKKGDLLLRAFQDRGPTVSHHKPMWRLFRVDRIIGFKKSLQSFRPAPGYNRMGDKTMATVKVQTK